MAIDLYSYPACLGTLVIDWVARTFAFAGMTGNEDETEEMTTEEAQATLAEHADNPDVRAMALIFWPENEQLCVHDAETFAEELEHDKEVKGDDDEEEEEASVDDVSIRALAVDQYGSSEINIDDDAEVSVGNDGAYVAAWVFVDKKDIPGWEDEDDDKT